MVKTLPSKADQKYFFFIPWAAQTAQTEEFMFQNVAYRPAVYRTGVLPIRLSWRKSKNK